MKKLLTALMILTIITAAIVMSVSANTQREVTVSSVEELKNALQSDTKIILEPGRYVFESEKQVEYFDGEAWEYEIPTYVNIDGLSNVTIEGNSNAEIVLDVGYEAVIRINNSDNITLSGLTLGHDVPSYGCEGEGHVILISESENITVQSCDLYGCGVTGIYSWLSGGVTVNDTIIRECMINGASFLQITGDITFNNCVFNANAYDRYYSQTTPCLEFSKDTARGGASNVRLNNCTFTDNKNSMFMDNGGENSWIFVNNCTFTNNFWENCINVRYLRFGFWTNQFFDDQRPVIVDGRTLVPLRGVLESLGYDVEWEERTRTAVISKYDVPYDVRVSIDSNVIYKGDTAIKIDVPACIMNDRTMVPIRAISEAFDMRVEWEDSSKTVLIYTNEN